MHVIIGNIYTYYFKTMKTLFYIFVGGGMGSCCRYLLSSWLHALGNYFPYGTFLSNVLSCLVLGAVLYYIHENNQSQIWKYLVAVGFCGGFSTFSTFSNELLLIMKEDAYFFKSITYIFGSLLFSFIALILGGCMAKCVFS